MPGKRKRAFVLFTGAFVVAALALTVAFLWPGLERRYHLEVLRRDPSRFEEMLFSERTAKEEAARDYLREPAGKQAIFRLYLDEYDRCEPSLSIRDALRGCRSDPKNKGVIALSEDGVTFQTWTGSTGHSSLSMVNTPKDARRRRLALELIGLCAGQTFRVTGFEKLEFQVQPVTDGQALVPVWPAGGWLPGDYPPGTLSVPTVARQACFFRVTSS